MLKIYRAEVVINDRPEEIVTSTDYYLNKHTAELQLESFKRLYYGRPFIFRISIERVYSDEDLLNAEGGG